MNQENTKSLNTKSLTPRRRVLEENKLNFDETPNKSNVHSLKRGSTSGGRSGTKTEGSSLKEESIPSSGRRTQNKEKTPLTPQVGTPGGTPYMLRSKTRELRSSERITSTSGTGDEVIKKDVAMPPLDLGNDSEKKSEFYKFEEIDSKDKSGGNDDKNSSYLSNPVIYSTPRKRARGANSSEGKGDESKYSKVEINSKEKNETYSNSIDVCNSNSTGRRQRSSSRGNIRSTPRTRGYENVNNSNTREECTLKDRKSILKQYDPDNVNTTTMSNIKTPKSQKKVQFGVKNLIIIDESLQEDSVNKLNLNFKDMSSDINLNTGDRMSILSEFDDPGSGNIAYNFPSLEELIGQDEGNKEDGRNLNSNACGNNADDICNLVPNVGQTGIEGEDVVIGGGNSVSTNLYINKDQNTGVTNDYGTKGSYINKEKTDIDSFNNENQDIADQLNILDYSIGCRDSITPNTPGAFLSVVMKNLSSVNFSEDKNEEIENAMQEKMDRSEYTQEDSGDKNDCDNCDSRVENDNFESALEVAGDNYQNQKEESSVNDATTTSGKAVSEEPRDASTSFVELTDQCVEDKLTENSPGTPITGGLKEEERLRQTNARLSELLTPITRHYSGSRNTIKKTLSPKSESLLNSLYSTKSILNIVPKGYTWEEFLSLLNLNYTMDSFNVLEFNDLDMTSTTGIVDLVNNSDNSSNKELISQLSNLKEENASYGKVVERYIVKLIKSIKSQVWEDIERERLMKVYTDDIFEHKYKNNLLRFPDSELATVLAIIVNKSRYGSKQDERVKNELLNRLSRYFSVENDGNSPNVGKGSGNIFYINSWLCWNEEIVFPYKNLLLKRYDECIKRFTGINERVINNKNRIQNSCVLLSTLESCQISEMHVNETYWDAMRLIHENINNYKEEIDRMNNYIKVMTSNKNNLLKLLIKEEELSSSLVSELQNWKYKKNNLKSNLSNLRIKEEFAGFTWDLFTTNKFQTIIVLNSNSQYQVKVRITIEWNANGDFGSVNRDVKADADLSPPVLLSIEPINDSYERDRDEKLFANNNCLLQDKIYRAYINIIEKTLNLRLSELHMEYRKQGEMSNNILIELIRGIFQSCTVLLWRSESIIFEILNITKVFNLAILDVDENSCNTLIMNIPILTGMKNDKDCPANSNNGASPGTVLSPITPNSLTSKLSPHLLISTRPIISIKFNITNSLFNSAGTLVNSIQDVSVYNVSEDTCASMIRIFKEQTHEIESSKRNKGFSAVYLGYNCLLSIIQNTIQEGGKNQLIWKRPLEKFAPRLLNAVQISKLHQNY
ncbi:hypothetical protein FG386_002366 [Cryptosporidium ryanae]|uniref:uncharacterized protein n=1 Tax=Cryptosporidium ryanae TaxID=515981 RepID=UPI00351A98FE|nr:hypothetical protein FG386_002366 [Cryptosporidium ryanae]